MIRFIYGYNLLLEPELAKSMFRDRAAQFANRLRWEVSIDQDGMERDVYDTLNPLYVIVEDENGLHQGSMRFLPTVGRTMLNEHFRDVYSGPDIRLPDVWECTRFCLAPKAHPRTSVQLLAAGGRLMRELGLRELVAVFDERMQRVYRRSKVSPHTLGTAMYKGGKVAVGKWPYDRKTYQMLLSVGEIAAYEMELYIANSDVMRQPLLSA